MVKKFLVVLLSVLVCRTVAHADFMVAYGDTGLEATQVHDNGTGAYISGTHIQNFGDPNLLVEQLVNGTYVVVARDPGNEFLQMHDAVGNFILGTYNPIGGTKVVGVSALAGGGFVLAATGGPGGTQIHDDFGAYVSGTYVAMGPGIEAVTGLTGGGFAIAILGQTQVHDAAGIYIPGSLTHFGVPIGAMSWTADGGFVVAWDNTSLGGTHDIQIHDATGAFVPDTHISHANNPIVSLTGLTGGGYVVAADVGSYRYTQVHDGTGTYVAGSYITYGVPVIDTTALATGGFVVANGAGASIGTQVQGADGKYVPPTWVPFGVPIHDLAGDGFAAAITPETCQDVIDGGYRLAADLDGDCYVGIGDFSRLAILWLLCNDPQGAGCIDTW